MSKFTDIRDHFESFISSAFHKGVAILEPLAQKVGTAVTPVIEAAVIDAGKAVYAAAQNGTAHGSQEMINVALHSLKSSVPELEVTVSTALALNEVQKASDAAAQAANAPLNQPPVQ